VEAGTTAQKSNFLAGSSIFGSSFQMYAIGEHYSLLITDLINKPSSGKKKHLTYK